jgi:pyridoxamine 5'-phosphate oxidase
MDIDQVRREYLSGGLHRENLDSDPIRQFQSWLKNAIDADLVDPTAMSVATVSSDGQPSQRIVLLKHCDEKGFVFYTNLGSRKSREIQHNSKVSLHFAWLPLERQVKICGVAEKLSTAQVLKYFVSRPKDSQIAALASKQSNPLSSRMILEQKFAELKQKYAKGEIPLPSFWGGYCVRPHEIEFWQGGANRLHDRFDYSLQEDGQWLIERLAP